MTKQEVIQLRNDLEKVLENFNRTSKIKMSLGNASYGDTVEFKLKGEVEIQTRDGLKRLTKEHQAFAAYSFMHGIKDIALNTPFKHEGNTIVITGYKSRSSRYPITFTKNGSSFKTSIAAMKNMIKTSAPEFMLA